MFITLIYVSVFFFHCRENTQLRMHRDLQLFLLLTLMAAHCTSNEIRWDHSVDLDENFRLLWRVKVPDIIFELQVRTHGYIGFGFTRSEYIYGADMVIGWVDKHTFFQVSFQITFFVWKVRKLLRIGEKFMINESGGNDKESCDNLETRQDNLATFMKSLSRRINFLFLPQIRFLLNRFTEIVTEQIFDFMLSRIYSKSIERLLQMFEVEKLFWLSGERGLGDTQSKSFFKCIYKLLFVCFCCSFCAETAVAIMDNGCKTMKVISRIFVLKNRKQTKMNTKRGRNWKRER